MSSESLTSSPTRETRVTTTGLRVRTQLTYEQWAQIGARIARVTSGSAWSLGDWLLYGERTYADRYRDAIEATQFDYQTLRNLAWVARAFDIQRRRETLSFSHHAEVASLPEPEQELWLTRAEKLRWSRNELRRQIVAHYGGRRRALAQGVLRVELNADRERRWREAAAVRRQAFSDWIAVALDAAAEAVLSAHDPGGADGNAAAYEVLVRRGDTTAS